MLSRTIFCTAVLLATLAVILLALFSPLPKRKPSPPKLDLSLYIQQPNNNNSNNIAGSNNAVAQPQPDGGGGAFIFHRMLTEGPENTSRVVGKAQGFIIPAEHFANSGFNIIYLTFYTPQYSGSLYGEAKHVSRQDTEQLTEARSRIEEALGTCLLPSLQLVPANPAVGQEIWEVMNLLPYEVRYRLYGEWEKEDEQIPMVLAARQTAKLDTRRILKRLAKENLKQLGRMVAKLAHANPMTVLRTIVHQVLSY
ncbi:hypothetical protein C1H46_014056 [Malus baccata]|uniref:Dirigent protein n=1 Tax=Malus baccata TaxID=106549 RepID=A0A540MNG7_MALBA|nr:hypothetical protein C1H46_014056 [Malus baccata]